MLPGLRAVGAVLLALATPLAAQDLPRDPPATGDLALMGTIPIYWGERVDFTDLLGGDGGGHWARPVIEKTYRLRPLDYLSAQALHGHSRLLLAQPRGLSAEENVALDAWVRGGGRLLLFADPLMTGHSDFALGDRRRPQDVALLSPILRHWGLELQFDPDQMPGVVSADAGIAHLPANLRGQLLAAADSGCRVLGDGLAARCVLGAGEVLVVADAALLDAEEPSAGGEQGLAALIDSIFSDIRLITGESGTGSEPVGANVGNQTIFDSTAISEEGAAPS